MMKQAWSTGLRDVRRGDIIEFAGCHYRVVKFVGREDNRTWVSIKRIDEAPVHSRWIHQPREFHLEQ